MIASPQIDDFGREEIDVAIRHGSGIYEGLRSDLLMREDFFPVCSPALLARGPRLRRPADLAHHVLLHQQHAASHEQRGQTIDQLDWASWLAKIGPNGIDAQRGPRFSFSHMTLGAAVAGHGVALASSAYIADDLATGRLVRPFGDLSVRGSQGFFIVCPVANAGHEKIVAFRNWALEEVASAA